LHARLSQSYRGRVKRQREILIALTATGQGHETRGSHAILVFGGALLSEGDGGEECSPACRHNIGFGPPRGAASVGLSQRSEFTNACVDCMSRSNNRTIAEDVSVSKSHLERVIKATRSQ
jgi:hypothetical protein